jgi:hypothetical protein
MVAQLQGHLSTWIAGVSWERCAGVRRFLLTRSPIVAAWCLIALADVFTSFAGAAAVRSVSGLTSITFIENTGFNKDYTFAVEDSALLTRLPNPLSGVSIRSLADLDSITFVENTGQNRPYSFTPHATALRTRLPNLMTAEDFHGVSNAERYDVFYSDADGTLNEDGAYITIEAVVTGQCPAGGGLNISGVRLNRGPQSQYAAVVSSAVYLGNNAVPGSASLVVDGTLGTDCTMGNTVGQGNRRLRVTVGFRLQAVDFQGAPGELYDVFYSNANGTLNNNGAYITIEAVSIHHYPSGGALNISEVRLNRGSQSEYGNIVSSYEYHGDNSIPDSHSWVVDGNVGTDCSMGSTTEPERLRVTVGFGSSSGGPPNSTRFTAHVDDGYAVFEGPSGHEVVHIVNHGEARNIDWWIDVAGVFGVQPVSGTHYAPQGESTIDLTFVCNCTPTYEPSVVTFHTTNMDGDNCIGTGTWSCYNVVGIAVPGLGSWGIVGLAVSLLGLGSAVFLHRRRAHA